MGFQTANPSYRIEKIVISLVLALVICIIVLAVIAVRMFRRAYSAEIARRANNRAFVIVRSPADLRAASDEALIIARDSPKLRAAIGQPIDQAGDPAGIAGKNFETAFARWSAGIKGPRGEGALCGVANRIGTSWEYSKLVFFPSSGDAPIDLTPPPKHEPLLPPPDSKVYLVPLDPPGDYSLDWAPQYYKSKLGIDVQVLPVIPLDSSVMDQSRREAVAEELVKFMRQQQAALAGDPYVVLLGVTNRDIFIRGHDWDFAVNFRNGNDGVISAARLKSSEFDAAENRVVLAARLQKVITKNVLILEFHLPQSDDYTSVLALNRTSADNLDLMTENIVGAQGKWTSTDIQGEPIVTAIFAPPHPPRWEFDGPNEPRDDTSEEIFQANLELHLMIERRMDFHFEESPAIDLVRAYRTQDNYSRAFGIGANHSLNVFIVGEEGKWLDLITEAGSRIHFKPALGINLYEEADSGGHFRFPRATLRYVWNTWHLRTADGWTYLFPYRPKARGDAVTVLTGMIDPNGKEYSMERNGAGDLLSVTAPSGDWLKFEYDSGHHIEQITDSRGRSMRYTYDARGHFIHTKDNSGSEESYTYDDQGQMLSALDSSGKAILANEYNATGDVVGEKLADGRVLQFDYTYPTKATLTGSRFTDPLGYVTEFDFRKNSYHQSLPQPPAH
ncbi:MAG: hypothetical protein WA002_18640 [Candidatus Acidiferrales bacterium]